MAVFIVTEALSADTPDQLSEKPQVINKPEPTGPLCELMAHPERTKIRTAKPLLGWIVNDTVSNAVQSAYQILVASSPGILARDEGDLWDSGKVFSRESSNVQYAGKPLEPNTTYHWKVRTWNKNDMASLFSTPQTFHTGENLEEYAPSRYPLVTHEIKPVRVVKKGERHIFIDFGRAAFGTVKLTLFSPSDNHEIEVHLGEAHSGENSINRDPGGCVRYRMIPLLLQKGTHLYILRIPPDERNTGENAIKLPDYVGEVMPFRYCEIVNFPCECDSSMIRQVAVTYPFDDNASQFKSSNKVLNDIWDFCKYSIKATSFCGVYVDGDRERIPYEADAYINQLGHYCVDREFTLARYSHEYLITHPTWPTEWILHSVFMAWADYMHTGDARSLKQYYADLKAKLLLPLAREGGLISTRLGMITPQLLEAIHLGANFTVGDHGFRDIVDWPRGERDNFQFMPINTVVNAFHYRALVLMSQIASAIAENGAAEYFGLRAESVKESINSKLFDNKLGLYVDGEGSEHTSLHANMFPLAFGLVPEEYQKGVIEFIKSKGMACSVYGAQYLLEALYEANEGDYALSLLTSTLERSWAHMIYDVGSTITLEAWDQKYKPNLDWNHAWGAAPANIIPRYLMGIQPLEPGFGKIQIKPQIGRMKWAEMTLPTIRGAIHISVENFPDATFKLKLKVPGNTTARVAMPRGDKASLTVLLDGKPVRGDVEGKFVWIDPIGSGEHILIGK